MEVTNIKQIKQDCCELKPHKCCGAMRILLGIGVFCAGLFAVHTRLEAVRQRNADFED